MLRLVLLSISFSALIGAAACGDDGNNGGGPGPLTGFAVVSSDFTSSSVSLLDTDGKVVKGDCFTSGTKAPGVTLALSGDVVLPSWTQSDNEVVTIDRTNSVLTWLDPTTCAPLRQLDVSTGFPANPHDVVSVSATKAYVLRYELNKTPGKKQFDAGDDLLIIDPSTPAITGRIDLSSYAVQVTGTTIQARADRARLIDGKLYVALSNLSGDFMTAGHGRILVIDVQTDKVTDMIEIPDLDNCSNLSYLDDKHTLIVACNGVFTAADQAAVSGIVSIDISASPPAITHTQPAVPFANHPVFTYSGIARDGALGFTVTSGDGVTFSDQLWTLDTAAGTVSPLTTTTDSFVYGTVLVDPDHEHVFLTDATATTPRLLVFTYANGAAPSLMTSVNVSPTAGLPPRELQWH